MSKKKHHEEHMDESWLIPYADLLTLLLALFIVLFAVSNVDQEKAASVSSSMKSEFSMSEAAGGGPIGEAATSIQPDLGNPAAGQGETNEHQTEDEKAKTKEELNQEVIKDLSKSFKTYVLENNLEQQMEVKEVDGGLKIILSSDVWFNSGSANISTNQIDVAKQVAKMLEEKEKSGESFKIVVSGNTDNVPLSGGAFKNNWGLSVARAVNFMEVLIENCTIDPQYFSARGLGEYSPIDTNDTTEGRAHNRRVEIFITY